MRRRSDGPPPPSMAVLAAQPGTPGVEVVCARCDRGVGFPWSALIAMRGSSVSWVAIAGRFRCVDCSSPGSATMRWLPPCGDTGYPDFRR